jgi:membrane fusion protein (multidrug efflux system)
MNTTTLLAPPAHEGVAPAVPVKRNKKRLLITAVAAVLGVGAIWYGADWWSDGRFLQSTDDAYIGGDVTVIGPKVPGYIAQVAVTDDQAVHAGDILVRIDDRDYRVAVQKAEGAVAAQVALIANLDATKQLQEAVIAQAQAGTAATGAEALRARDDQTRYKDLSAKEAASLQSSQKADSDFKQAVANNQRSQATLMAAQRQIDVIAAQKQQAQAALTQAEADRDLAKLNLGYTVLRSPIDGTVGNRRARAGAYASAGSQLLAIVPARGLWVDANFKEGQLSKIHPGERATIEADVMPGHAFHGRVASIAPATGAQFSILPPENATGNFTKIVQRVPIRILLDDNDSVLGTLRPGLSVTAEVDSRTGVQGKP